MKTIRLAALAALSGLLSTSATAADAYGASSTSSGARYTFSWPLDADAPKPRGGTTKGPPVVLDKSESPAWQRLQEKNIDSFERDRRAILAMAGEYRVTFDFLEIVSYPPLDKPPAPYQSWGTEKIYIDIDEGKFISLVHILEMRVVQNDGSVSEPIVTKHWRQDWQYEPTAIVEYLGRDRWRQRKLGAAGKGAWLQTVYQVDESPRYASIGRWEHTPSFSTWLSGETWRPLPRREWSVRDDYQVLIGTNRHTIVPTGWLQEENNLKAVLTDARTLDPVRPYLGREYGVARYERIKQADFAAADRYYERTQQFWSSVRGAWTRAFEREGVLTLRGPVDKLGLFVPLFERADEIVEQPGERTNTQKNSAVIRSALEAMGVPGEALAR
ncbi:MAG TPA: DUF6607 family protein [Steroidobacteraceae bacterium]